MNLYIHRPFTRRLLFLTLFVITLYAFFSEVRGGRHSITFVKEKADKRNNGLQGVVQDARRPGTEGRGKIQRAKNGNGNRPYFWALCISFFFLRIGTILEESAHRLAVGPLR